MLGVGLAGLGIMRRRRRKVYKPASIKLPLQLPAPSGAGFVLAPCPAFGGAANSSTWPKPARLLRPQLEGHRISCEKLIYLLTISLKAFHHDIASHARQTITGLAGVANSNVEQQPGVQIMRKLLLAGVTAAALVGVSGAAHATIERTFAGGRPVRVSGPRDAVGAVGLRLIYAYSELDRRAHHGIGLG